LKDKKFTAEHRAKISKAKSGKKRSAEACANISKGKKDKNRGKYRKKQILQQNSENAQCPEHNH
jgi:hypothetical protein